MTDQFPPKFVQKTNEDPQLDLIDTPGIRLCIEIPVCTIKWDPPLEIFGWMRFATPHASTGSVKVLMNATNMNAFKTYIKTLFTELTIILILPLIYDNIFILFRQLVSSIPPSQVGISAVTSKNNIGRLCMSIYRLICIQIHTLH